MRPKNRSGSFGEKSLAPAENRSPERKPELITVNNVRAEISVGVAGQQRCDFETGDVSKESAASISRNEMQVTREMVDTDAGKEG
jgi:hypothetical protein